MTVHRDLDELEKAGLLRKVRGGATIDAGTQFESDFQIRKMQEADVKLAIAFAAAELVEPGMTVIVNDGSMAAVLGEVLLAKRPLTLITNNAEIMDRIRAESGLNLISLGGTYSAKFDAYFGMLTDNALGQLSADIAFISTPASHEGVVYHMDEAVVRTKRAMMKAARKKCLLINSRRFGHTALHRLADLTDFNAIVSDQPLPPEIASDLERSQIEIKIAKLGGASVEPD